MGDIDKFSDLRGNDLQNLIIDIENLYLEYRDTLNLPLFVSFGVEIEYEQLLKSNVDKYVDKYCCNWVSKQDGSLRLGGEINSPIMFDHPKYWDELKNICQFLKHYHADTLHRAGGHVHVGVQTLGDDYDAWITFVKILIAYEHVLYRFFYGDKVSARAGILKYASPMADDLYDGLGFYSIMNDYKDILIDLYAHFGRNRSVNFGNVNYSHVGEFLSKNTIEFRVPNGTSNEVIWQNNINVATKMLLVSRYNDIDVEYLDYKINHDRVSSSKDFSLYHVVCLKNSLEFVDMIFDNYIDKVYFLRQYFKNFENNYGMSGAVMAKRFVKK